ncbi:hypothetical protein MKK75_00520, partial [Methylobacterium sp. J-030]|uniref:hypothetical protein n=1 Tax=Methylobacterium sp. J-030 TaxID=2836627 RepID=UPI001FBB5C86
MSGRRLSAARVPTLGPWLVRGEAEADDTPAVRMLGVEPATEERPGGWPYFIRRARPVEFGGSCLHIATGIQRLADAKLIAAVPDLTTVLLRLLTTPELMRDDLAPNT